MAVAAFNKNGDGHDTPQLESDVMKIFVVGEPKCGKTSFIRTFARDDLAGQTYTEHGSTIYPYQYYHLGELRRYAFVEVPGLVEENIDEAIYSHIFAKGCILMYAIDDPSSINELRNKWLPALDYFISDQKIPTIAVGFKADLRENPQVIARLALANLVPVTAEEGNSLAEIPQILSYFECSQNNLQSVNNACAFILTKTYEYVNPQNE